MVTYSTSQNGLVGAFKQSDYYSFYVNGTQTLTLDLSAAYGQAGVTLYDASGRTIDSAGVYAYNGATQDGALVDVVTSGTYYAKVSAGADSQFTLSESILTPTVGNGSTNRAGATLATATPLPALTTTPLGIADYIGGNNPNDYYAFTVGARSNVSVDLSGLQNTATISILNASGTQIVSTSASLNRDAIFSQILPTLSAGNYYLLINDGNSNGTGYNLAVSAAAIPEGAGTALANAHSIGTLTSTPATFNDSVGPSDTADYYSFQVGSPSLVTLGLGGLSTGATLSLLNASGSQILATSGSANSAAVINTYLTTLQAGTYYAEVSGNTQTNYSLAAVAQAIPNGAGVSNATATPLPITTTQNVVSDYVGTIDPLDTYSITLTSAATVNLRLQAGYSADSNAATLSLQSASGSPSYSTGAGFSSDGLLTETLNPGTYYIQVAPQYSYQSEPYSLYYSLGAVPVGTANANSAGTSIANALNIGPLSNAGASYPDYVGPNDPNDYYQFTVAAPETVRLDTFASTTFATSILLLNISGAQIASNSGGNNADTSIVQQLSPGTYFVDVQASNAAAGYSLFAQGTPIVDNAGPTTATAKVIGSLSSTAQTFNDFVGPVDPADYYTFTLAAPVQLNTTLSGLSAGVTLSVLNIAGVAIASDGANATNPGSLNENLAAGTYYLEVSGASNATNYALSVSDTPINDAAGTALSSAEAVGSLGPVVYTAAPVSANKPDGVNGLTSYTFALTRSGDTSQAATLAYSVAGSGPTPAATSLFGAPTGSVTFAAGSATASLSLAVYPTQFQTAEAFTLTLAAPSGSGSTNATATGTIQPTDDFTAANKATGLIASWASYVISLAGANAQTYTGTPLTAPAAGQQVQGVTAATGGLTYSTNGGNGGFFTEPGGPGNTITTNGPQGSFIASGNGADTINSNAGNNWIATGAGATTINLNGGGSYIASEGADNITATSGRDTVEVSGNATIHGGGANLVVFSDAGSPTITAGTASVTVYGAFGGGSFAGGSAGNNVLVAGTNASTIMGGGNGDVLLGSGGTSTRLIAASGNETLTGQFSSGNNIYDANGANALIVGGAGTNAFNLGYGNASIVGGTGANTFNIKAGSAGGTDYISNFHNATDKIHLAGYGSGEIGNDLSHSFTAGGSQILTLSDGTVLAFLNQTGINASSFA